MAKQTEIDSHRHDDASRKNIPTSELQSFVSREEPANLPPVFRARFVPLGCGMCLISHGQCGVYVG